MAEEKINYILERDEKGRIIKPLPNIPNSEIAKQMANRRIEMAREAFIRGLSRAKPNLHNSAEAIEEIARIQASLAMDASKGRTSTEAARLVLRVMGLMEEREAREAPQSGIALLLSQPAAEMLAEKILAIMAEERD